MEKQYSYKQLFECAKTHFEHAKAEYETAGKVNRCTCRNAGAAFVILELLDSIEASELLAQYEDEYISWIKQDKENKQ